jgi:calcium-dependent protein kinase
MLMKSPRLRITCQNILSPPWITREVGFVRDVPMPENVIENLVNFVNAGQMKKAALQFIAITYSTSEMEQLRKLFLQLDADNDGYISHLELTESLQTSNFDEQMISKILAAVDMNVNGQIDYSEFLAATMNIDSWLTEVNLQAVFNFFDANNDGFISSQEL